MTKTVFRSKYGEHTVGSAPSGQPLARFHNHTFSTDDASVVAQLSKQPTFGKTPGAGEFWIDGPLTAQVNSVPAIKAPETTKEPDATTADPNAQQTAANNAGGGGAGGEGDNNGDQGKSSPETVPPANPTNANSGGTGGKKSGGGGKGAKASE